MQEVLRHLCLEKCKIMLTSKFILKKALTTEYIALTISTLGHAGHTFKNYYKNYAVICLRIDQKTHWSTLGGELANLNTC